MSLKTSSSCSVAGPAVSMRECRCQKMRPNVVVNFHSRSINTAPECVCADAVHTGKNSQRRSPDLFESFCECVGRKGNSITVMIAINGENSGAEAQTSQFCECEPYDLYEVEPLPLRIVLRRLITKNTERPLIPVRILALRKKFQRSPPVSAFIAFRRSLLYTIKA